MEFNVVMADLRVDKPDFKASGWRPCKVRGKPAEYSECYELVNDRWEGFVAVRPLKGERLIDG